LGGAAACTQGPDYQQPVVPIPPAYRFEDTGLPSSAKTEAPDWWKQFGDPVLERMIRECIANNRDLNIATARVDEFDAILRGTESQAYPQIGYDLSASRKRTSERIGIPFPPGSSPLSSSFGALLVSSWEIDLWGRIRRETEAARANLLATTEARRGVILTLVASVITSYVTLLDLDDRLQVANDTLAGRKESVVIFRKRLEAGYISDYEMAQVEAEYESAVAAVPDIQRLIAVQESALSVLLGRNPGPIERGRNLRALGIPVVPASLPAELLTRRPDILAAEQQLIASNALIGAARALYFPQISLTGIGGLASKSLGNLFTGTARTWTFTGDVAGPIYTGGGLQAATDQAVARRKQSLAAYELTIQNAFREVEDALITVQKSRELEQSVERRVESLKQAVKLVRVRYENGYTDYLNVLDTERSLFSAELTLATARGDTYRALANLYRALGGDWVDQADRMAIEGRESATAVVQSQ
jgi:multidrug efflux system outer membrane protein